jgi:hypothetical protein
MCEMNEPESRLSAALRRLSATAPRSAPQALGDMLKDEFRRHHFRRRRERNARILLTTACLAAFAIMSFLLRLHVPRKSASHEPVPIAPSLQAKIPAGRPELRVPRESQQKVDKTNTLKGKRKAPVPEVAENRFVALPTFDPAIPIDHSEMVRVDLPGRALRLVGFPISEEIADRRVVADVLLAQDGTPYALRLVQNLSFEEQ